MLQTLSNAFQHSGIGKQKQLPTHPRMFDVCVFVDRLAREQLHTRHMRWFLTCALSFIQKYRRGELQSTLLYRQ